MKNLLFILTALFLFSCKEEATKQEDTSTAAQQQDGGNTLTASEKTGEEIFNGKGNCYSCHKPQQKVIGPSIAEIAGIYARKNGDMVSFLRGKADPIVDPSQYSVMKTNFYITKHFTDEEMQGVVDYMMHFK